MLVLTNETSFVLKMMGACRYPGLAADVGLNVTEAPFMVSLPKWVGRVGSRARDMVFFLFFFGGHLNP